MYNKYSYQYPYWEINFDDETSIIAQDDELEFMAPSERSELGAYQTVTGSGVQPQGAHGGLIYG